LLLVVVPHGQIGLFRLGPKRAGNVLCIKQFGDAGGDQADNLVVNRFASQDSGQKDLLVMRGLYAGSVSFGSTTLTTPILGTKYGFVVGSNP
jgi:hypothetical protein